MPLPTYTTSTVSARGARCNELLPPWYAPLVRIELLYPPPWKIAQPDAPAFGADEGPPEDYRAGDLDADFYQTP